MCESHFSVFPSLAGDQETVVVERMPEAVVEGDTQVYVFTHV